MIYRRYGKFSFKDHLLNGTVVLICVLCGIIGLAYEVPYIYCSIYIWAAVAKGVNVMLPYRERFEINEDTFVVYKGKKMDKIVIPSEFIVIISYADVCTEVAKRTSISNRTCKLKDRFAISFLQEMPLQTVLEKLHGRYTNCWIEEVMKQKYIYGFVCNQDMLEKVLVDRNYILILPETLSAKIDTTQLIGNIYIDKEF